MAPNPVKSCFQDENSDYLLRKLKIRWFVDYGFRGVFLPVDNI
jgi:hypothetical protein